MNGYTDIHTHFLYGLDDGAQTREQMEAMLDAAHADGISTLFATPHVSPGLSCLDTDLMLQHLLEARAYCREKQYPLEIFAGAEILYTPMLDQFVLDNHLPTLDDTRFILVEFVPDIPYQDLDHALDVLEHSGYGYDIIIAHVERIDCMFKGKNIKRIKENHHVLYQVNCNSILRKRGFLKDFCLNQWFAQRLIDLIATDTHNTRSRPTRMREAYTVLCKKYGAKYADALVNPKFLLNQVYSDK